MLYMCFIGIGASHEDLYSVIWLKIAHEAQIGNIKALYLDLSSRRNIVCKA